MTRLLLQMAGHDRQPLSETNLIHRIKTKKKPITIPQNIQDIDVLFKYQLLLVLQFHIEEISLLIRKMMKSSKQMLDGFLDGLSGHDQREVYLALSQWLPTKTDHVEEQVDSF